MIDLIRLRSLIPVLQVHVSDRSLSLRDAVKIRHFACCIRILKSILVFDIFFLRMEGVLHCTLYFLLKPPS
jgi:hypothetical protein